VVPIAGAAADVKSVRHARRPLKSAAAWPHDIRQTTGVTPTSICIGFAWPKYHADLRQSRLPAPRPTSNWRCSPYVNPVVDKRCGLCVDSMRRDTAYAHEHSKEQTFRQTSARSPLNRRDSQNEGYEPPDENAILFLCYARTTLAHERGCETCLQHTRVGTRPICFSLVILRIDLAPPTRALWSRPHRG
jgi:hypothetical protein